MKHSDPLDWELVPNYKELTTEKKIIKGRKARIVTVSEDQSVARTAEQLSGNGKDGKSPTVSEENEEKPPFAPTEFEKNEIGF